MRFLVTPGTEPSLFDQSLLEKISGQVKEDSFITSSLPLAKLASAKSGGKGKPPSAGSAQGAGSSRYSSPLDYSRPGPSGYGKRSASPARGSSSKQSRGGRDVSPLGARKGFRK